jgi:hypothetical protein
MSWARCPEYFSGTFTTEPRNHRRKGHSPIRGRCLEFLNILEQQGYLQMIPLNQAIHIFQIELGICDRSSIRSYFGSRAHKSIRKLQRFSRYSTGTVSQKTIELAQDIPEQKGYLELLGLATFREIGNNWFLVLQHEPLVPEMNSQHYESPQCSKHKISFSPNRTSLMLNVEEFEKPAVTENSLTGMAKAGVSPRNREAAENVTIRTLQTNNNI